MSFLFKVGEVPYYDGTLSDSVPIEKAFELGCDRRGLLLTLPTDTVRKPDKDRRLARGIRKWYPLSAVGLERRAQYYYNESVALARRYVEQGKVLIVASDDICGVGTLKRNAINMRKLYEKGYGDGAKILPFLSE